MLLETSNPQQDVDLPGAIEKAVKPDPQAPKILPVVINGKGEIKPTRLPENKDRLIQTVYTPQKGETLIPSMAHLGPQRDAMEKKGIEVAIVITNTTFDDTSKPSGLIDGNKCAHHLMDKSKLDALGMDRASVQKSANALRASERKKHIARLQAQEESLIVR